MESKEWYEALIDEIKYERKRRGYTIEYMAKVCGCSQNTYHKLESYSSFNILHIYNACEVLGIELYFALKGGE